MDNWLRSLGFYGSVVIASATDSWTTRLRFGYRLPMWLLSKSITVDLQLASNEVDGLGLQILPGSIRMQNRVSLDSPFMQACLMGDVGLIKQHLLNRTGHVGDRASCSGKTPLLVSSLWTTLLFYS